MIQLYSFGASLGVADPSPFVLKVDAYLRFSGIEFESSPHVDNLRKAPKGKLPFITDDSITIADSELIIRYLQEKYQVTLDAPLSDQEKAQAYLLGKALDENLYWCLVYSRWAKNDTWQTVKHALFGSMPFPLRHIVPPIARQFVLSALKKQGTGKHSDQDIHYIADRSFQALSQILGEKAYFFGDSPCTFDATVFAFLAEFILVSLKNDMNSLAHAYPNLVRYCEAISTKYY